MIGNPDEPEHRRVFAQRDLDAIYATEPEHSYAVAACIRAWRELGTCRPIGMAVGWIPIDKVWQWCDRHGFDRAAADMVESVIMQLDQDRAEREAAKRALDQITGGK